MKTIDTRGTILEVRAGDEKSNKDAASSEVLYVKYDILGQSAKHDGCDAEDRRSETEEHVGGIVVSEEDEVLDPEEYTVNNILPKSRHRDGSIYMDIMDTPWKKEFHIADRNEIGGNEVFESHKLCHSQKWNLHVTLSSLHAANFIIGVG